MRGGLGYRLPASGLRTAPGVRLRACVTACALGAGTTSAWAQSPVARPASAATAVAGPAGEECATPGSEAAARRGAERAFDLGSRAAARGQFDDAARWFECSYRLVPTPQGAYNAGLAYEQLHQPARAVAWLRRYVDLSPFADDRRAVEQRIEGLERGQSPAGPATGSDPPGNPRSPGPSDGNAGGFGATQSFGLALVVAGADAVAFGTVLHLLGWERAGQGGTADPLASEARTLDVAGTAAWVAGAALVAGGTLAMALGGGRGGARASARGARRPWVMVGGAGVVVGGTF